MTNRPSADHPSVNTEVIKSKSSLGLLIKDKEEVTAICVRDEIDNVVSRKKPVTVCDEVVPWED